MTFDTLGVGAGPVPLGPTASLAAYPVEAFESPILNLATTTLGIEMIPAKPGYFPSLINLFWIITSKAGTQTTPPTCRAGANSTHDNLWTTSSTTPSNASVNGAAPPSVAFGPLTVNYAARALPNTPIIMDVTTGAQGTGGFTLRAKMLLVVFWLPEGST